MTWAGLSICVHFRFLCSVARLLKLNVKFEAYPPARKYYCKSPVENDILPHDSLTKPSFPERFRVTSHSLLQTPIRVM